MLTVPLIFAPFHGYRCHLLALPLTMEPSDVEQIQLELEKEAKWSVQSLVFKIPGTPPFDIIPYLG
jgi:hypothetical protein